MDRGLVESRQAVEERAQVAVILGGGIDGNDFPKDLDPFRDLPFRDSRSASSRRLVRLNRR
jgi:hypothetical protein